ncbi:hypothetical protein [Pseudomonas phage KP1]|uniref:Uncharacterized protein n=1 Tax=Pseudomonas phage KP1 TaxID=2562463 RepID=A0A6G5QAP4_9CAUD|nr:hypothetical protein PM391_gp01 [Pseudomonas phage KP1]QBZ71747.1 hypothetical protein [Pseudomonas phage KP1]
MALGALEGGCAVTESRVCEDMHERPQKIIDAKFPLPWLIGSASAIVFSMGGVFVKLDGMSAALNKIETKAEVRDTRTDERINVIAQGLIQQSGRNDTQDAQLARAQSDINEVKRDVEDLRKSERWMPK